MLLENQGITCLHQISYMSDVLPVTPLNVLQLATSIV